MTYHTAIITGREGRKTAHKLVDAAPFNAVVTVKPPARTLDQNAKFHAMLSDVSRAKPEGRIATPDVWKALFMHACGHAVQFEMGLNGQPFPIGFRSSRLTKDQMCDLITFMLQWGDERGVRWSNEARQ